VELHNKETNMNINNLIKIARTLDHKGMYREADKITTAMMKKESMLPLLLAMISAIEQDVLINNLSKYWDDQDLSSGFDKFSLKGKNSMGFQWDNSEFLWRDFFQNLEETSKPIKNLKEPISISMIGSFENADKLNIPILGQSFTYYELKDEIISRAAQRSNTAIKMHDNLQGIKKPLRNLEGLLADRDRQKMEESGDPIPEE
jgi:hypothetical protein